MDYMDIDEESNVPDTPDRIVAQNINARDFVEKDFLDEGFRNRPKDKSKLVTDNGSRRLLFRPAKNSSIFDKYERVGNSTVSSLDDSSSSENAHPFERMFGDKIASDQKTHSIHSEEDSALVDLTEWNGHAQEFENARCEVGSSLDRGKGIGFTVSSQPEVGKTVSASLHPSTSRRVTEQRRLVRNGCISPHNIAKAKESAENHGPSCVHSGQNNNVPMAPHGPSSLFGMRDLIAEANDSHRLKGKGSINHPFPTKGSDAKTTHLASRSSTTRSEKADGTSNASGDALRSFEGGDGWRSTRNRTRKTNPLIFNEDLNVSSRDDDPCFVNQQPENGRMRKDYRNGFSGRNHNNYTQESDSVSFQNVSAPRVVQTVSDIGHQSGHFSDHQHAANALMKRQKQVSSSSNHGLRILDPVIEVDEFSPEIRNRGSNIVGGSSNDDSDVRARQVEADEILARELQEELYNEAPVVGVDEIDSHIALAFQQEEDSHQPVFGGSHREFYPRGSLVSNLYRQFESSSSQNPSIWRDTPTLVPTSTRMARLRDRFRGQPHTISSSTDINSFFPPNVDMDMRIRILEALEAFSELEMSADLPVHRDFNENDYEMLLALDENNHQVGASPAQINGLPQSTVQSDNLEETCAICLETPSIGDTIRHLPCVHRFHKDCIDPWLRRRTSCPICKSSIT